MEVNLDDMTGEELAWLCEGLREAGALDVWSTPVGMKKGRPGIVIGLLCRFEQRARLEQVVFERSSTLGLRWHAVERREAVRGSLEVTVAGSPVRVKVRLRPGAVRSEARDLAPEYEDLAALARTGAGSLRELAAQAVAQALRRLAAGQSAFGEEAGVSSDP